MRLLLNLLILGCSCRIFSQDVISQDSSFSSKAGKNKGIDVNFLFSYYDQNGDHSAVTGGRGTEQLSDYSSKIILNVPLDSARSLDAAVHVNYYTSASTDRINDNISSASRKDVHSEARLKFTQKNISRKTAWGLLGGAAIESDYISGSVGGHWTKSSSDDSRVFTFMGTAYFDAWQLIFPDELRASAHRDVRTDKRRTLNFTMSYAQVLTPRIQVSFITDFVFQHGLLSTPFHRVYFSNTIMPRIEKLPATRLKFPMGFKVNYAFGELLASRVYYRFYFDNFGIIANTFSIELPFRIYSVVSIAPFYRFHIQSASDYFREYGLHAPDQLFYTSDYDLSAFADHKVGVGIGYIPRVRIVKPGKVALGSVGIRWANYFRSDGLKAFVISCQIGIKI